VAAGMSGNPAGIYKLVIGALPALEDGAVAVKPIACHIKFQTPG
jgi:hypothetical protein